MKLKLNKNYRKYIRNKARVNFDFKKKLKSNNEQNRQYAYAIARRGFRSRGTRMEGALFGAAIGSLASAAVTLVGVGPTADALPIMGPSVAASGVFSVLGTF